MPRDIDSEGFELKNHPISGEPMLYRSVEIDFDVRQVSRWEPLICGHTGLKMWQPSF